MYSQLASPPSLAAALVHFRRHDSTIVLLRENGGFYHQAGRLSWDCSASAPARRLTCLRSCSTGLGSCLGFSLCLYQRPAVSKKKEERTKQHQPRVIQFFSAVVIGNVSASLDYQQRIELLYLSFNQPYTFILVQSNNSGCFVKCPTVFCVLSPFS